MSVLSAQAIFLAVFIIGAVWADEPHLNAPGYKCTPKSTFQHECNTCRCNDEGTFAACTFKACIDLPKQKRQTNYGQRCIPNQSFTADDGCNTCRCSSNGVVIACTRKACVPRRYKRTVTKQPKIGDPDYRCVPGTTFLDDQDCNTCHCASDGIHVSCTEKLCIKKDQHKRETSEPKRCTPNTTFKKGCQTCYCDGNGAVVQCVSQSCNTPNRQTRETKQMCEPKSTFQAKDGCNTCHCNDDGTNAVCTLKACLPNIHKRESRKPKVCEPSTTFMDADNCNSCKCNQDGTLAACTLKYCPPKSKRSAPEVIEVRGDVTKVKCDPSKKYVYQCNDCQCTSIGLTCTKLFCTPGEEVKSDVIMITDDPESYTCEQGKNYQYLCNTCTCVKGNKLACTRMSCGPLSKRSAPSTDEVVEVTGDVTQVKCEEGKAYKYQCNDCQCLSDGKLACSRRVCAPQEKQKRSTDDEVIQVDSDIANYKCEQGKKYKYLCNNCRCLGNNRLACTRRVCGLTERSKRDADEIIQVKASELADYKCEKDKKYRYECNECRCVQDKLACTRRMCAPGETRRKREEKKPKIGDPDYRCTPGAVFLDDEGCNTCVCSENGKDVGCTDMSCDRIPQKRSTKECTEGETKTINCNSCNCEKIGWVCTKKACVTLPDGTQA